MNAVRLPAVAGLFYPREPEVLHAQVIKLLQAARAKVRRSGDRWPKALIVPHAGYVYSGPVAACGYALLEAGREVIRRAVLIGPSHRVAFSGLAVPSSDVFRTPLGDIALDKESLAKACTLPFVDARSDAHAHEHSVEVHLPLLQETLGDFCLAPIVVGIAEKRQVSEVLDLLWGGRETVIVISSDLSHYLEYDAARVIDASTANMIEALDSASLTPERACGQVAVQGVIDAARAHGLAVRRLDLRNSGDTAGSRQEVVGYGAWSFEGPS